MPFDRDKARETMRYEMDYDIFHTELRQRRRLYPRQLQHTACCWRECTVSG